MAPRQWQPVVADFSRVMKLTHLVMRKQPEDAGDVQVETFKQKRQSYENEMSIQAANVGCAGRKGVVPPVTLTEMMTESREEALGIINTYNYDLAMAIRHIQADVPTANRYVYAKRLAEWDAARDEWKSRQIMLWDTVKWQDRAARDFLEHNPEMQQGGYANVEPKGTAVCDICQFWVGQGKVKIERIKEQEFPAHLNCPHHWVMQYRKRKVDCSQLWVGQTLEMFWEQIGE